jgi:hypothetical protein
MFAFLILTIAAIVVAQSPQHYAFFGPMWGWYSIRTEGHLLTVETTLHPNAPPTPPQIRLALWPGMNVPKGLIQPAIIASNEPMFLGA